MAQLALHYVDHDEVGGVLNWLTQVPPGSTIMVLDHQAFDDTVLVAGSDLSVDAVTVRLRQWADSWMDLDDQAHYGIPAVYIAGFRSRDGRASYPHIKGGLPC